MQTFWSFHFQSNLSQRILYVGPGFNAIQAGRALAGRAWKSIKQVRPVARLGLINKRTERRSCIFPSHHYAYHHASSIYFALNITYPPPRPCTDISIWNPCKRSTKSNTEYVNSNPRPLVDNDALLTQRNINSQPCWLAWRKGTLEEN